jgi:hypothetical protein
MAEFKLGRLRFVWKNTWAISTAYVKDDIVRYGGKAYVCVSSHTSSSTAAGGFYTDLAAARWQLMNDGIQWAQTWTTNTYYKVADVVKYGGRAYICITGHTSAATATLGLENNSANWEVLVDGIAFAGAWSGTTRYKVNDVVGYGGQLYLCTTHHTSIATFEPANWSLFASGLQFEGAYNGATLYQPGDVVTYGSNSYVAVQSTTGNLPTNATYWTAITTGIQFRGAYDNGTAYRKGDIVSFGAYTYVAKQDSTGNAPSNATYWDVLNPSVKLSGTYAGGTTYNIGEVVQYGGYQYVAKQTTTGNLPTNATYWDVLVKGYTYAGTYSSGSTYKPGELVDYGGSIFAAKVDVATSQDPSDNTKWDPFSRGFKFQGVWSSSPAAPYVPGDIVRYGGHVYVNILTPTSNQVPTNATYWTKYVDGLSFVGNYADATAYKPGEAVRYGGRVYLCILGHTSDNATNIEPPNATYWELLSSGMKWMGTWSSGTEYDLDDVVSYLQSSYISIVSDNIANDPVSSPSSWQLVAQTGDLGPVLTTTGDTYFRNSAGAVARLPIGTNGQILVASAAGIPNYENNNQTANVYYVTPEGSNSNNGRTMNRAFASIRYACTQVSGPATIYVKSGTYSEQLPIVVPPSVAIVGDGVRTTTVAAAAGTSTDGSTLNSRSTMFLMSNASMVKDLNCTGMDGFVKSVGTPTSIEAATRGGAFFALNPDSPVTTKSPYVQDVTTFSTGGIGALIDGGVHGSGYKSMVLSNFTAINDGGVGVWTRHAAKVELVSVFTYYCVFGYASSDGGQIRALNGNNSYGTYGSSSEGYDNLETPVTGALYGGLITYQSIIGGSFSPGQTITGQTSGATGTVLSSQEGVSRIYYKATALTFQAGETISNGSGVSAVIATGGVTGQKGYVLAFSGLSAEPKAGASITITGDSQPYIIQTVADYSAGASGYKPAGYALVILTTEKTTASVDTTTITLRYRFSTVRLTGHDFLNVGTGGISTTNYPGTPSQLPSQANEVIETYPGRVYYVTTDQDGNFRVGEYFKVDQATGKATLNASAFDLSGLTSLRLGAIGAQLGELINEFSSDTSLGGNSNSAVPTEAAVKTYVDTQNTQTNVNSIAYSIALGG